MVVGIVFGFAFKLLLKAVVMPLLGADPINHHFHLPGGQSRRDPRHAVSARDRRGLRRRTCCSAAIFFERLGQLLGTGARARVATLLLTSALFALLTCPNRAWRERSRR